MKTPKGREPLKKGENPRKVLSSHRERGPIQHLVVTTSVIAEAAGISPTTVRTAIRKKEFDPTSLESVMEYVWKRRAMKTGSQARTDICRETKKSISHECCTGCGAKTGGEKCALCVAKPGWWEESPYADPADFIVVEKMPSPPLCYLPFTCTECGEELPAGSVVCKTCVAPSPAREHVITEEEFEALSPHGRGFVAYWYGSREDQPNVPDERCPYAEDSEEAREWHRGQQTACLAAQDSEE